MSQQVMGHKKAFTAGAARDAYLRVMIGASSLSTAGATDSADGVQQEKSFASTDVRDVLLRTADGTRKMVANGAITAGNYVYAAASGKVGATGFICEGKALETATADGDVIEVLNVWNAPIGSGSVAATGSSQSDAAALTSQINYVSASDGTKGVLLPTAVAGLTIGVYNTVATNGLKIYPATGADINDGTANAAITIEGKTLAMLTAVDTTTWAAMYTVNT